MCQFHCFNFNVSVSISRQRFRATMWWKAESDFKLEDHLLVQSFVFLLNHEPFTVFVGAPSFSQKTANFFKVLMYFSKLEETLKFQGFGKTLKKSKFHQDFEISSKFLRNACIKTLLQLWRNLEHLTASFEI